MKLAIEMKPGTGKFSLKKEQINFARNWLASKLNTNCTGTPAFAASWRVSNLNDQELGAEILKIAKGENETDLESVLDVMLNS
tara:strand:+ start:332 stop:580 length:249 start_codon:yes stop_codon:yes gene_type:complete